MSMRDANGNADIHGPRPMSPAQIGEARQLMNDFNALAVQLQRDDTSNPESARLMSMARSHLEIACMCAVKALSRE